MWAAGGKQRCAQQAPQLPTVTRLPAHPTAPAAPPHLHRLHAHAQLPVRKRGVEVWAASQRVLRQWQRVLMSIRLGPILAQFPLHHGHHIICNKACCSCAQQPTGRRRQPHTTAMPSGHGVQLTAPWRSSSATIACRRPSMAECSGRSSSLLRTELSAPAGTPKGRCHTQVRFWQQGAVGLTCMNTCDNSTRLMSSGRLHVCRQHPSSC